MTFHASPDCPDPTPGSATSAVGPDGLAVLRLDPSDAPDLLRSVRALLKACGWAEGFDRKDLELALRASALALELAETSASGDPRMTCLTTEDVGLLGSLGGHGSYAIANALNRVAGRVRPDSGPGPLAAVQACKSFPDLFSS